MQAIAPEDLFYAETLPGGAHCSFALRRGSRLRLTDLEGRANVGMLLFHFEEKSERYNMPDTLKAQHIARLTRGDCLYSDMGRILASIPEDELGWHDPLGGFSDAALVANKYGNGDYQELRNDYFRNGQDSFLMELGRWGLGRRDLSPCINFFSKVTVDSEGMLHFHAGHSRAGAAVDLRAELNCLLILHSCPHPLDPTDGYRPGPVRMEAYRSTPGGDGNDPCRLSRPENGRGFDNTLAWFGERALIF